ncbi:uncharacterized protein EDB91DRAFT_1247093 [Suillus paluster]|uniref:uncharacterized protein n=1 Tax=Suillus paluster TaxID=48578 RepID=UPI001B85D99A|nr:uncharacterized protein EDB91DRAFT_1247093 [Suillus paluster]KAG1743591.1 hypothetical protein EDB91DRAFT_1247093 [Suillus paluster]
MSTPNRLKKPLPRQAGAEDPAMPSPESLGKPHFMLASVAALYLDSFVPGFSNAERHAAAHALLRHESHQDGTHYHTETPGGLHPSFIKFNEVLTSQDQKMITHEEFVEAALEDVFDALCMQDRLDGGISLLIRCPGSQATDSLAAEHIAVDVYVTPRELHKFPEQVGGDVSLFVQGFCEQMAKHHLQCFTERCRIEDIQPPHRYPAPQVNPTGSQALPAPLVLTGSRIQFSARPPLNLNCDFKIHSTKPKGSSNTPIHPPSSFVQHTTALASDSLTSNTKPRRRRPADAFSLPRNVQHSNSPMPVIVYGPPIISIGPNTDVVLDRFRMGDGMIPELRELMTTGPKLEAIVPKAMLTKTFQVLGITIAVNAPYGTCLFFETYKPVMLIRVEWQDMSSQTFYASSTRSRRIQPSPRCHPRVQLSKEARILLTASRREKSRCFKTALDDVWARIDESVKTIASSNGKTIHRVQHDLYMGQRLLRSKRSKLSAWNAFCWKKNQTADKENGLLGKAVLPDLVQENRTEYHELSADAKASLLKEYEEHKAMKTTGTRISTKSKVNNVTQTLKAVENELNSLRCRTGAETILYTTRSSTDLPLCGIAYATEGVQDFMESVMNIDNQDLVSKMEGFAMSGICEEATGDPDAKMQWAHYWRNIVQRYLVICEGWPDGIPFGNLSKVSNSFTNLEMLLRKWKSGDIYWRQMDNEEFEELHRERNEKLNSGEIIELHRRTCSDKGKKCTCTRSPDENDENPPPRLRKKCTCARSPDENDENLPPRRRKKTHKSLPFVDTDTDTDTDNNNSNVNGTTPAPLTSLPSSSSSGSTQLEPSASLTTNGNELPPPLSGTGFNISFDFDGAYAHSNQLFAGPSAL